MAVVSKGALRKALDEYLADLNIPSGVKTTIDGYFENYEDELIPVIQSLFDHFGITDVLSPIIDGRSGKVGGHRKQILIGILIGAVISIVGSAISSAAAPTMKQIQQRINTSNPSAIPDVAMLLQFLRFAPIWNDQTYNQFSMLGFAANDVQKMLQASQNFPNPDFLHRAVLRGFSDDKHIAAMMRAQGYSEESQQLFVKMRDVIPPLPDLITMAVREAFNDEAVIRFKLDANFPDKILPFTRAQGLTEEWVKRYWRSHWQLPSTLQAFEMYQRLRPGRTQNTFTRDDLESLLITADIPEYFRSRMVEIAYSPVTRVDIRRLYKMGIYTENDVYNAYQDIGYSPENAKSLTKFTVLDAVDEGGNITRANILKSFRKGYMSEATATKMLLEAGNGTAVVQFDIAQVKNDLAEERHQKQLDLLTTQYISGIISYDDLAVKLNGLGLISEEIQTILIDAKHARDLRQAKPTKTDIENWYEERLIGAVEYTQYMRALGYELADIQRFLRMIDSRLAREAQKEYERTQKELQRINAQRTKDIFAHQIAQVDVQIAQVNLQIANKKLAIARSDDPAIVETLSNEIVALEVTARQFMVSKAQIKAQ